MKAGDKPIEEAHSLPNECYTSIEYLKLERNKIFSDKWTVIRVGSSTLNKRNDKLSGLLMGFITKGKSAYRNIRIDENILKTLDNMIKAPKN